jgi:hypothetical protein
MQINLSGISLKKGLLRHFIGQYKWVASGWHLWGKKRAGLGKY